MLVRRLTAILLLLFATGNAAAPTRPASPAGRQAFNRCLAQADTAWQAGRRADALRWYHSAKRLAKAHNLTFSNRDMALVGLVTRHEAGVAGPQPGRTPGCQTDGTTRQPSDPATRLSTIPAGTDGSRPVITKTIPPPEPAVDPVPATTTRTIPDNTTRVLTPPTSAETSVPSGSTLQPATLARGTRHDPPPASDSGPTADAPNQPEADNASEQPDPAPPEWPDIESAAESGPDDLVPPVTPPRTSAPKAPPRPPRDQSVPETSDAEATDSLTPAVSKTSATTTTDIVVENPVKLTIDRSAVPISLPDSTPSQSSALSTAATPPRGSGSAAQPVIQASVPDHQLILMMFGPIVIALFILGLLTQEMPGPIRMMAWFTGRGRDSASADQRHTATSPESDDPGPELLTVRIGTRRRDDVEYYTATIELPGLESARIVKLRDRSPLFRSRAAAVSSARHTARRLGFSGIVEPAARRKAA